MKLFKRKKKSPEVKIEDVGGGVLKVTPQKAKASEKEFYKDMDNKSVDDFLKEIALKTRDLWMAILKLSIKKNSKKDSRETNRFLVFAESVDISMAVMRTLKAQLVVHGNNLEMLYKKEFGKSPNLIEAVHQCIQIANAEDLKKIGKTMTRRKKDMQSYVA